MLIYFHNGFCSYLPKVPILVEDTVSLLVICGVDNYFLHYTTESPKRTHREVIETFYRHPAIAIA